jgi:hypothetical protein
MMRYGVPQEAGYELEAINLTTAALGHCAGLEGGFISFDEHALMLSTIERLIDVCEKFILFPIRLLVTVRFC